jgi:hypothetical protein
MRGVAPSAESKHAPKPRTLVITQSNKQEQQSDQPTLFTVNIVNDNEFVFDFLITTTTTTTTIMMTEEDNQTIMTITSCNVDGSSPIETSTSTTTYECSDYCENIFIKISCILSYGGNPKDIIINYSLIILNLLYCIFWIFRKESSASSSSSSSNYHYYNDRRRLYCAIISLVFVVIFQITLCLWLGCSGVSIIWCAVCGWIMSERRKLVNDRIASNDNDENINDNANITQQQTTEDEEKEEKREYFVICMNTLIICYYAVILPFITTVAHICALVLGAFLSLISMKACEENENESNDTVVRGDDAQQQQQPLTITSSGGNSHHDMTEALLPPSSSPPSDADCNTAAD